MVHLTRLKGGSIIINGDLIEMIESTPDTLITLVTGKKMMVLENPDEVIEKVINYRRKVGVALYRPLDPALLKDDADQEL